MKEKDELQPWASFKCDLIHKWKMEIRGTGFGTVQISRSIAPANTIITRRPVLDHAETPEVFRE